MARRVRELRHGATYHVGVRANRREMIFYCSAMKQLFLEVVKRAKKKYRFELYNFCIMSNHVHLIIRPEDGESLSRIMQWILSVFAMKWNRKHLTTGHVWGGRFWSKILGSIETFIRGFDYVTNNPVRAGLVRSAEEWPYGGIYHFLRGIRGILEHPPPMVERLFGLYVM